MAAALRHVACRWQCEVATAGILKSFSVVLYRPRKVCPAGAFTAAKTTLVRTFVTYRMPPGVCCLEGQFSSGFDGSDDVTDESVGSSSSPGWAWSVCSLDERLGL